MYVFLLRIIVTCSASNCHKCSNTKLVSVIFNQSCSHSLKKETITVFVDDVSSAAEKSFTFNRRCRDASYLLYNASLL